MSIRVFESSGRWSRLVFDGEEKSHYDLRLRGLKDTILNEPADDAEDEEKNAEAYAEPTQFLDNQSLSLVTRDADGKHSM